jgi:hypothetical protein
VAIKGRQYLKVAEKGQIVGRTGVGANNHPTRCSTSAGCGKVWLEEPVTAANIAEFEGLLTGIFERWLKIFEKTGGFPKQP